LVVGSAGTALAALDGCQKAVAKENQKLASKMTGAINKCADSYQKAVAKGDPVSSITAKCNANIDKSFNIANGKSAIAKALGKLNDTTVKGKCTDVDRAALGHLSEATFGDKWQRWLLIAAWNTAYQTALSANSGLVNIFQEMLDAGGCPLCSLLSSPPCTVHNCVLGVGSGGPVNFSTGIGQGTIATTVLTGATPVSTCNVPSVFPTGELALVGGPSKGIDRIIDLLPGVHVCVETFRSEGYVNCNGAAGNPRIDTDICVDHIVFDTGGGNFTDDCETMAPGESCLPRAADPEVAHAGTLNGGACLNLTANTAVAGDAFFLATSRIQVVLAAEVGPDNEPCTFDDVPAAITVPATIPQTTGEAFAQVFDPNNDDGAVNLTVGPVTGVAAPDCDVLQSSDLSGFETVSAAAALHGLPIGDSAFSTRLVCQ
jgi:hypothetical protein